MQTRISHRGESGTKRRTVAAAAEALENRVLLSSARFAVVGDYGADATGYAAQEGSVANLIKSWNAASPLDAVVTTGDNNYEYGEWSTIDQNIGKYYSDFIGNYVGSYGPGAATNKFYPVPGNHDWDSTIDQDGDGKAGIDPYTDYFTLPGNERYYTAIVGPVQIFAIDSDPREPDGRDVNSAQAQWLRQGLAASTSPWQIVVFHHPSYSSGSHGSDTTMQWPFAQWGADLVLNGHDHSYERLSVDGIPYIVNGLGGKTIYSFNTPIAQSQFRYNADVGAQLMEATDTTLAISFYNSGYYQQPSHLIDSIMLDKNAPPPPPPDYSTATFQQSTNGYASTADTQIQSYAPDTSFGTVTSVTVDSDEPPGTGQDSQALLRFDSIFGAGPGQVPSGSQIVSAKLELTVIDPGNTVNLHRLLRNWSDADTWNSLGAGVQNDGVEALATADASLTPAATGLYSIDVTASLSVWASNPSGNFGWAFLPTGNDGVDFDTSEGSVAPRLVVNYNPPANPALPVVSVVATDPAASETGDPGLFTITRTGDLTGDLIINYSVGGTAISGSDYQPLTGTITIPAGQSSTAFSVVPIDDALYEPDETVVVTLASDPSYMLGNPSTGTVTIASDDPQPVAPTAPTLSGKAVSPSQIDLSWTDSSNETGYILEWSSDGKNWSILAALDVNATSYSVTGLKGNNFYYFRVEAVNQFGESPFSNLLKIRTPRK
jgi:tartrate-resistant acid phosphatase type 5